MMVVAREVIPRGLFQVVVFLFYPTSFQNHTYFTILKISVNSTLRVRLCMKIIKSLSFTIILPASMFDRTEIRSVARCCDGCPMNVAMGGGFGSKRLAYLYCGPFQLQEKERRGFTFIIYNHDLAFINVSAVKR